MEIGFESSSGEHLTSMVGFCSDLHSCKHSGPLRSDAVWVLDQGCRDAGAERQKKIGQCQKHQRQMLCSVQRLHADVLAQPHKEPLMSALPTKDRGTNKDSIVIRLLQCHPKKTIFVTRTPSQKTKPNR